LAAIQSVGNFSVFRGRLGRAHHAQQRAEANQETGVPRSHAIADDLGPSRSGITDSFIVRG
jgi:hypothetical protein